MPTANLLLKSLKSCQHTKNVIYIPFCTIFHKGLLITKVLSQTCDCPFVLPSINTSFPTLADYCSIFLQEAVAGKRIGTRQKSGLRATATNVSYATGQRSHRENTTWKGYGAYNKQKKLSSYLTLQTTNHLPTS